MRGRLIIVLISFLSLKSISQIDKNHLIDELLSRFDKVDAPGLSVGIVENGKLIYSKGIGLASVEDNVPNSSNMGFGIASLAKQFTAACIWVLVEKGQISLEDDIRKFIPEMPAYSVSIRVKHLLNHTSGIRNYHALMQLQGFDYDKEYYNNDSVLHLLMRQKNLSCKPGEMVLYSNSNYTLLAIIVERVSGMNLNDFATKNLFEPLEMSTSCIRASLDQELQNLAVGYQYQNDSYVSTTPNQESYGAGSMMSSVEDLSKWMNVLVGKKKGYESLSKFLLKRDKLLDGSRATYARGVMIGDYKGAKIISHSGYSWGGQSQLLVLPMENIGIVILTNLESINATSLSYEILNVLQKDNNLSKEHKRKSKKHAQQHLQQFTGEYKEIGSDMRMAVYLDNDTLKARGGQSKRGTALIRLDTFRFHRKGNESVVYDFSVRGDFDMAVSFGGTPFYFKRAKFIADSDVQASDFTGEFYSSELNVSYYFTERENRLYLSFVNNEEVRLNAMQIDEFGNGQRTLYHFKRNEKNEVIGMLLSSEGTVRDVLFSKK